VPLIMPGYARTAVFSSVLFLV